MNLTTGRRHHYLIIDLLADHRPGNRRLIGDFAGFDISLVDTNDLIADLFVFIDIKQRHRGTKDHSPICIDRRRVNHIRIAQTLLNFRNTALGKALLFTRSMIFSVLFQVTVRPTGSTTL